MILHESVALASRRTIGMNMFHHTSTTDDLQQSSAWRLPTTLCLVGLIVLSMLWELWLAPLREGGSWLVLKALILAFPLPGIISGRRYTYQWASMLILLFVLEGTVRLMSDVGPSRMLAAVELGLSLAFFTTSIGHIRALRKVSPPR